MPRLQAVAREQAAQSEISRLNQRLKDAREQNSTRIHEAEDLARAQAITIQGHAYMGHNCLGP